MLAAFAGLLAVILVTLVIIYFAKGRGRPDTEFRPGFAWLRAGIYFSICYLISYATGTMQKILDTPIVTSEQLKNPVWWAWTVACFAFIFIAYTYMWVHFTATFDRKKDLGWSALFGILWGTSSGQLFLSAWVVSDRIFSSAALAFIVAASALSIWQGFFHAIYWDHYVSPEHDTPLTLKIKTVAGHAPNVLLTLSYVAVYGNYTLFILFQTIALTSASIGMRFPSPFAKAGPHDLAAREEEGIPWCTGYISEDYTRDPYTPFYPGWVGPAKSEGVNA